MATACLHVTQFARLSSLTCWVDLVSQNSLNSKFDVGLCVRVCVCRRLCSLIMHSSLLLKLQQYVRALPVPRHAYHVRMCDNEHSTTKSNGCVMLCVVLDIPYSIAEMNAMTLLS